MPPLPKPPALRQRRNKTSTHAVLSPDGAKSVKKPPLPEIEGRAWHPLAVEFWDDIWASPMAPELVKADVHGLYRLVEMISRYWNEPSTSLAAEIRMAQMAYGLTPLDRRRLQWEIERVDSAKGRKKANAVDAETRRRTTKDPRDVLKVVS